MEVIIIGAGGFAKQVIEAFHLNKITIRGLVDDFATNPIFDVPIIGKIHDLENFNSDIKLFCGIGDIQTRKNLFLKFSLDRWINCIHPKSNISIYSNIGHGNYIGPFACLMPSSIIGDNNIIDTSAIISHDCKIGDHNHLAGNSCLLGKVSIRDCNLVGANSTILPQLEIGSNVTLGAGAVLTKSIDNYKILTGIPARVKRLTN